MPLEEYADDKGEHEDWVELTIEEHRCLAGLRSFHKLFCENGTLRIDYLPDETAAIKAWVDLKKEFPRLEPFRWYK